MQFGADVVENSDKACIIRVINIINGGKPNLGKY